MQDFILQFTSNAAVSKVGDSSDPDYNPIYLILDSTNTEPTPSEAVELYLRLPSGYYCDEAEVKFGGTTAAYWEVTKDDPAFEPLWHSSITTSVHGNDSTIIYVRAHTTFEEVPVMDRSVSLDVVGDVRSL